MTAVRSTCETVDMEPPSLSPTSAIWAAREEASSRSCLPLYLLSLQRCTISALPAPSGGALLVQRSSAAGSRFPLARISRIVSSVEHDWRGNAIALCFQGNVPVVFLQHGSKVAGSMCSFCRRPSKFSALLEEWLGTPAWRPLYTNWLRSERNRALLGHHESEGVSSSGPSLSQVRQKFVYQEQDSDVPALWQAATLALVLRFLGRAGLAASYAACDGSSMELASDCERFLLFFLRPSLEGILRGASDKDSILLHGFEAGSTALVRHLEAALGRLHRLVAQEVDRCR